MTTKLSKGDGAVSDQVDTYIRDRVDTLIDGVTDTTADDIADLIGQAASEGWSPAQLASHIVSDTGFDSDRAMRIAETELSAAEYAGALAGMKDSGVQQKAWVIDDDVHKEDDDCDDNVDDDAIGIDEVFSSGDMAPPAHPNCACYLVAIGGEDSGDDEGDDLEEAAPAGLRKYSDDESRDDHGRWTDGGSGDGKYPKAGAVVDGVKVKMLGKGKFPAVVVVDHDKEV